MALTDGIRLFGKKQVWRFEDFGVPIDVLWMAIPKDSSVGEQSLGYIKPGKFMVLIDRRDYFQCGFLIPKGQYESIKQRGLAALQAEIFNLAPFVGKYVHELDSWEKISLLTVKIDRLRQWYRPGVLCVGDAAHAMSPAGGVGINMAIQDAVATANILAKSLRKGTVSTGDLARVQRRRQWPVRVISVGSDLCSPPVDQRCRYPTHRFPTVYTLVVSARTLIPTLTRLSDRHRPAA